MVHSFKTISKLFRGSDLILEGLKGLSLGREDTFCRGFVGATLYDQTTAMPSGIFFEISSFRIRPSLQPIGIHDTLH